MRLPAQAHCDARAFFDNSCTEYNAGHDSATLMSLEENCTGSGSIWMLGTPCPSTGADGGCQLAFGSMIETGWYYDIDAATLESDCLASGGVFLLP